ncbi:DUF3667 domain-containing protein [Croceibacterium aestuarii]|uniref:DUF3667 domain-containing protein n=1 Tax=Croceibacterium aestuarii TaxID=3064139 RepID=UPI00272DF4DE|nr:DUF3667 domain-containing protein [Croceibacterium sp. D39]
MGDFGEALGTVVEGGLYSRAVEPARGETGRHGHTHESACLNCGTELVGPHCHACGQHAHIHRTIGAFMHDLLHGVLHADGKTFRTLPLLAWKPGELTRRYIEGERARFVSPMALFLFAVFLMFAVFQLAGIAPPADLGPPVQVGTVGSPAETEQRLEKELAELKDARKEMGDGNPGSRFVDMQIDRLEEQLSRKPADAAEGTVVALESGHATTNVATPYSGIALIDHGIDKWRTNPSLMAYKLQSNSYKFSWLLIPLSVPFVWLLFLWRRRFGIYDHSVFVTYSLAFMTLFYVVLVLLSGLGISAGALRTIAVVVPPIHIYRQLKGAYGLTRFSALWRTTVLCAFIFVILFLFIDVLLVLGALG